MRRFLVETTKDNFDPIEAKYYIIEGGGALTLFNEDGKRFVSYNPFHWITIVEDED